MRKLSLAVTVTASLGACGQPDSVVDSNEPTVEFANDDARIIYALGALIGEDIVGLNLSEDEFALVSAGMRDVIDGLPPRIELELYGPQISILANERMQTAAFAEAEPEKLASAAFADEKAAESGAERMASGVVYLSITEGDGANPTAADTVTVHYHGTLRDGTVFDSSVDRGVPSSFPLGGVIPCWTEGVQRIRVGGKANLLCPSDTAYGDAGRPGIPGGAALLFEVELLSID